MRSWEIRITKEATIMRTRLDHVMVYLVKNSEKCFYKLVPISTKGESEYIIRVPLLVREFSNGTSMEDAIRFMEDRISRSKVNRIAASMEMIYWNGVDAIMHVEWADNDGIYDKFIVNYDGYHCEMTIIYDTDDTTIPMEVSVDGQYVKFKTEKLDIDK